MKKILILANDLGGLYKFRKELLEVLVPNNKVIVVAPDGIYFNEIKLISMYHKLLKKHNPDIVFSYTIKPNIYGGVVCNQLKIPYVANITGLGTAVENPGLMQRITLKMYKIGLKKAQKVFFQNKENINFMISKGVIKDNYDLLPGSGVNLEQYKTLEYPDDSIINFLFVSRLMKEKGIDQYLEAARYFHKKYTNVRFHICGSMEDDYDSEINKLNSDGIIVYHGIVKDMIPMYKISSCTIHPTYYPEGLSNVLLESCACGRPIITTNRSGCREVVDDGVNGYIVKEKNSDDLINKMEKFMRLSWEEKKHMGIQGRKKVEKEFNRRIVIEKYLQEVDKL